MSLTGNYVDAKTAEAWGLINRVFPADQLVAAAKKLAFDIASCDPVMVEDYKNLIDHGDRLAFGDAMELERRTAGKQNRRVQAGDVKGRLDGVFGRGRSQKL